MITNHTLGVNYFFNDKDLRCLEGLIAITTPNLSLQDARKELHERVFLDPSFQGWTLESFRDHEPIEILRDYEDDPNKLATNRQILLGYYRPDPRSIVLFPNAIRLVSERKGLAVDVLTRVVLVHELAHWFTLDGTSNRFGGMESGLWPNEPAKPSEYAETLAELVSWLVFNTEAAKNMTDAKEHLRQQYLLNDPAPHYTYQLYWFWLVAAGVARGVDDLRGESAGLSDLPGAEHLHKWIRGGNYFDDLLKHSGKQFLGNLKDEKKLFGEGFQNLSEGLHGRFEAWEKLWKDLDSSIGLDSDLIAILDI